MASNNRSEEKNLDQLGVNGMAALRHSAMMSHLLDALEQKTDIGEYGRLTFVMVARHFLDQDELTRLISEQPGMDTESAQALIAQVQARGYSPPKRERILEWQSQQDFQICPNPDDPKACNIYRELEFPQEIYDRISEYWEEKSEAHSSGA